ncbi:hypothetical protein Leryth_003684 [Lithospermum erythrorhizon]|nr:hypothetical protein Leryth_003684 [Lithospermum erythrorhizon]
MSVVGRLGGIISKSVVSVSAPFHPFGGAVDIIVVEQPDGSYKSSPWYVKFGKFQGVLKANEKIVSMNVNDVDLDFHMHLDNKGDAYFLHKNNLEEGESVLSSSSSGEDTDGQSRIRRVSTTQSGRSDSGSEAQLDVSNVDNSQNNSKKSRILGLMFGRKSIKENRVVPEDENATSTVRAEVFERAEVAADLLEVKWSTNLDSPTSRDRKGNTTLSYGESMSNSETPTDLKRCDGPADENVVLKQNMLDSMDRAEACDGANFPSNLQIHNNLAEETVDGGAEADVDLPLDLVEVTRIRVPASEVNSQPETFTAKSPLDIEEVFITEKYKVCDSQTLESGSACPSSSMDNPVTDSCAPVVSCHQLDDEVGPSSVFTVSNISNSDTLVQGNESAMKAADDLQKPVGESLVSNILQSEISEEEQLLFGNQDDFSLNESKTIEYLSQMEEELQKEKAAQEASFLKYGLDSGELKEKPTNQKEKEVARMVKLLPNIMLPENKESSDVLHPHEVSTNSNTERGKLLSEDDLVSVKPHGSDDVQLKSPREDVENRHTTAVFGDRSKSLDSSAGRWKIWPFPRRSVSIGVPQPVANSSASSDAESSLKSPKGADEHKDVPTVTVAENMIRALTPTSEQLATLHLKEGKNIITFTFSTQMLGKQQVDAQIYLWRWDTRIVISDVDGTIAVDFV